MKKKVDWGRYGRGPLLLLAAVALIDSVDRGILPGVLPIVQKRMAEGGDLAQDHRAMRIPTISKIVERLVSLYDKTGGEGPAWQVVADVVDRALELADATRP